jgi:hypothetical protein
MRSVLVVLSLCLAVAGCDKAEDGVTSEIGVISLFDPAAVNPSLCGAPAIPFPNNALFADGTQATGLTTDTTLNIPSAASTAVAANLTDGFSTTASIFTDVLGSVDLASTADGLIVLEADATPRILAPGIDYTVQSSTAMAQVSGTGGCALDATVNTGPAKFQPISQQRTRILIEPLKPLAASTTYIVAVTNDLRSSDGVRALANEFFPVVNSDVAICDRNNTNADPAILDCTNPAAPADAAARLNAPALTTMTAPYVVNGVPVSGATAAAARLTTLETLRANLVRPTVTGMNTLFAALGEPTLADEDLVVAWSFTTQSIGATMATLNAIQTAKSFTVSDSGLDTGNLGLTDSAHIWTGTLDAVPYYLDDASGPTDAASQTGFWLNNGAVTSTANGGFVPWTPLGNYDGDPNTPNTPAPCTTGVPPFNWAAPVSTTNCHRIPTTRSTENLPVIITVPKTAKPVDGWPVVVFQHGITGNRTQMLALGPTLASAGFVTVAIDLPLHGVLGPLSMSNPFYQSGNERHFELDVATGSGSCLSNPAGDGATDPSGTCFINLVSLITSRDNLRQAAADLIHLVKSLGDANLNFDGVAGNDIDTTQIHFAGISLGSIVGTTMLGVNTDVQAASIHVPGGGLGKLLDASATFGPVVAAGLASAGAATGSSGSGSPFEGTDTYETFVRFAQHLVDPGDPINYAVAANANHPIHMTEVIGDTVVPNSALSNCPDADELPLGIGGTPATNNTVEETREAACEAGMALVGADPNVEAQADCDDETVTTGVCTKTASQDETLLSGYLSGTEPLFAIMGLDVVGPITPPTDCATASDGTELDVVVQFAVGSHGSLLSPAASAAATAEMQRQTTSYFLSGGTNLDLLCSCP